MLPRSLLAESDSDGLVTLKPELCRAMPALPRAS